jgi:hypothetical protein
MANFHDFFARVASFLKRRQSASFVCSDCEHVGQCAQPPHEDCLARVEQIERDPYGVVMLAKRRSGQIKL